MIAIRQLLSWHADARENRLRPAAVGGVPIESFVASQPTCPQCGRSWTVADVEDAWFHIKLPMPCDQKPAHERRSVPDRRAAQPEIERPPTREEQAAAIANGYDHR